MTRPISRKDLRDHLIALSLACLAVLCITAVPALAQSTGSGWEEPATGLMEVLESGLVKIGVVLIGIGVIAYGMWGAVTARIDWTKFGMILIGGLLVMTGPTMSRTLLESVQ